MYEVVYLTGAPAAGKSSLTGKLRDLVSPLEVFEFGERLTQHLQKTRGSELAQADLRRDSSKIASAASIKVVDQQLLHFCKEGRFQSHLIIDSHPVTKESYGFRVTPYSLDEFAELAPTQIWMLYTSPNVALERIARNAGGRPQISEEEARFHTHMQASVAITYGMKTGCPVHLFDADRDIDGLARELAGRFRRD